MRILVADDEATSRMILGATLTRLGHRVEVVEDGAEAWAALMRDQRPELAVLDWNMPGFDGPELCRKLRQQRGLPYTYTILVTSRSSPHDAAQGLEAGADDFVAKPFDPEELRARVRAGQRIIELQAEMARSRAYLEAVLTNIDSGVLLVDHFGRVVYANEALARMSGTAVERMIGLTRDDLLRLHAARFDDPDAVMERLGLGHQLPLEAELDVDVMKPEQRTFRWIGKPIALPEGPGQLDLYRDVTHEVERDREQEQRARIDHLTGLYNRRAADETFARELSRSRRTAQPLALVLSDIDLFKRVNDTCGHNIGDRVLQEISRIVLASCRVTDVAIRWGGEELLVLLPDTSCASGMVFAERLRASVEALEVEGLPHVTISCGVAELHRDEATLASALERADVQLYEAKASGRNAVR